MRKAPLGQTPRSVSKKLRPSFIDSRVPFSIVLAWLQADTNLST